MNHVSEWQIERQNTKISTAFPNTVFGVCVYNRSQGIFLWIISYILNRCFQSRTSNQLWSKFMITTKQVRFSWALWFTIQVIVLLLFTEFQYLFHSGDQSETEYSSPCVWALRPAASQYETQNTDTVCISGLFSVLKR